MSKTENDETKNCIEILERVGIKVKRKNTGAVAYNKPCPICKRRAQKGGTRFVRFGEKGEPDLAGFIKSKEKGGASPFFWEVKKKGVNHARPEQLKFINEALKDGCFAGFGDSKELKKYLEKEGLR